MKKNNEQVDPNAKRILEKAEEEVPKPLDPNELKEGEYVICKGCGEKMPKTIHTCVTCGARLKTSTYTPISEQKAAKIRWIVGGILLIVFFVVYFVFFS